MKFKNIKKKVRETKKTQSPSNSRRLTESFKFSLPKVNHVLLIKAYNQSLKIFVALIFVIAVIIVGFDFKNNLQIKQNVDIQREVLTHDLNFWKDFTSKKQNYPNAYFQISMLEYQLGNMSEAKMYVEKGLALDPNSPMGKKIEGFLVNK